MKYNGERTKIKVICKICNNIFEIKFGNHTNKLKQGCPKCANKRKVELNTDTKESFELKAKLIHGEKYCYNDTDYIGCRIPIKIFCNSCENYFEQKPYLHVQGSQCKCQKESGTSNQEQSLIDFIKENYTGKIEENCRSLISPKEVDCYIPELKIAIEYNGLYYHSELFKDNLSHMEKTEACESIGVHLIHIYEDEWINKTDIVKSRLLNILHKNPIKIKNNKCKVIEVSKEDANIFIKENHIQDSVSSSINIGLIFQGELVSLMTFGNKRIFMGYKNNTIGEYELLRFCNKKYTTISGAASRMFKYFIDKYNPTNIISYADRSWSMNSNKTIYKILGFKLVNITKPNYYYILKGNRKSRYNFTKYKLINDGFDSNKTEKEIMLDRGIYRIYNSGNLKYSYDLPPK